MKKMLSSAVAIMVLGTSFVMAVPNTDTVLVNIEVAQEAQLWADHNNVSLLLEGKNGENSDVFQSALNIINNVDAKIDVEVTGTLPDPSLGGGGIQFFIFDGVDEASAYAAIVGNAYGPAGALAWNEATLGDTKELTPSVGVNTSIAKRMVTYAAAAPGELPMPSDWDLTVVFTIIPN